MFTLIFLKNNNVDACPMEILFYEIVVMFSTYLSKIPFTWSWIFTGPDVNGSILFHDIFLNLAFLFYVHFVVYTKTTLDISTTSPYVYTIKPYTADWRNYSFMISLIGKF